MMRYGLSRSELRFPMLQVVNNNKFFSGGVRLQLGGTVGENRGKKEQGEGQHE